MAERASIDQRAARTAELKLKEMQSLDALLLVTIDSILPHFPNSSRDDYASPLYCGLWVNPEEAGNREIPAIVITPSRIAKTRGRNGNSPKLEGVGQLSYDDYQRYFQKGFDLLRQFAEIEKLRQKSKLTPQELKDLIHLIYKTAGGDENYEESSVNFAEHGAASMQITLSEPRANFASVVFYNGLPEYAGEKLHLVEKEDTGELAWKIGTYHSFYSQLLEKPLEMDKPIGDPIYSKKDLNPEELAILGRKITNTYLRYRNEGICPTFFC